MRWAVVLALASGMVLWQTSAAFGQPPGWGTDVRLTNDPAFSGFSRNTVDASGNVHVVWQGTQDDNAEIYYLKTDPNGAILVPATRLTTNTALSWFPAVAKDASGNLYVSWMDDRDGNAEIYLTQLSNTGATLIDDTRLTNEPSDSTLPALAVGLNGRIHVVWAEGRDGNGEIYYREWQVSAGVFAPVTAEIRLTNDLNVSWQPTVAVDSNNHVHVVFIDDRDGDSDLRYTRITNGTISIPDTVIMSNAADSAFVSIARDTLNQLHVVWVDTTAGNAEIHYMKLNDSGGVLIPPSQQTTDPANSWWPTVSSDASDHAQIVWVDTRHGNFELYSKKLHPTGSVVVADTRLTNDTADSTLPAVGADLYSNLQVVWNDARDLNEEVYAKRSLKPSLSYTGTPSPGNTITFNVADPLNPGRLYFVVGALGSTPGIPLGDGRIFPANPDPLFFLTFLYGQVIGLTNAQGTLNAQGQPPAAVTWTIPTYAPSGLPIKFLVFSMDAGLPFPQAVVLFSDPITVTIQ